LYISGLLRQPKWGHLRDLHKAIKQAEPVLVSGDPTIQKLGNYEKVKLSMNINNLITALKYQNHQQMFIHHYLFRPMSTSQRMELVLHSFQTTT
jgi:hypothetical protein